MKQIYKTVIIFFMLFFIVSSSLSVGAIENYNGIEMDKKGSISIDLKDNNTGNAIGEIPFVLYKVANLSIVDRELGTVITDEFKESKISIKDINADGLAVHLLNFAKSNNVTSQNGITDQYGNITFDSLDLGIYLVAADMKKDYYYLSSPFLVTVPCRYGQELLWDYDIDATPKTEMTNSGSVKNISVKKIWKDDGNNRPEEIEVQLLKNNIPVECVKLNRMNSWCYTWKNLNSEYNWQVIEKRVPDGYIVSYSIQNNDVVVTNSVPGSRPKTGDSLNLWKWVAGLIIFISIFLICIVCLIRKKQLFIA